MMESIEKGLTALFFSALPYRRVIFSHGGWPALDPNPRPWDCFRTFLTRFWTRSEIAESRSRACSFYERQGPREAVLFGGEQYPAALSTIYDPPPVLFVRSVGCQGPVLHAQSEYLAVVGTRRPDAIALTAVDRLAVRIRHSSSRVGLLRSCVLAGRPASEEEQPLLFPDTEMGIRQSESIKQPLDSGQGANTCQPFFRTDMIGPGLRWPHGNPVTVSGFAFGIDERIHRTSLALGIPTVAVLGSGIDCITPAGNRYLMDEAIRAGVPLTFLSEFFPDEMPRRFAYPRRNRIIAGMARVCFIMQAGIRSGAMITAIYALEEGRDICAFDHPDLVGSGKNEGARQLLEDGAGRIILFSPSA